MRRVAEMAAALGVVLALGTASSSWAQVCSTSCSRYEEGQCVEHEETCTTPEPPPPSYGAIAYGRSSRAFGFSYRWPSQAKAERVALQNCAEHGDDCEIMVWFEHNCGAVAAGSGTSAFWGLGDGDGRARAAALGKCREEEGEACKIKVSACSR